MPINSSLSSMVIDNGKNNLQTSPSPQAAMLPGLLQAALPARGGWLSGWSSHLASPSFPCPAKGSGGSCSSLLAHAALVAASGWLPAHPALSAPPPPHLAPLPSERASRESKHQQPCAADREVAASGWLLAWPGLAWPALAACMPACLCSHPHTASSQLPCLQSCT